MNTIKLQQRGVLTLPKTLRDKLDIKVGQSLRISSYQGKIILEPEISINSALVNDLEQGIRDLKAGKYIQFSSIAEMHEKIKDYGNTVDRSSSPSIS